MAEAAPKVRASNPRALRAAIGGWVMFIVLETATQVAFKYAGATLDDRFGPVHLVLQALSTPIALLGFALYFAGFLVWMTILKDVDLGRAFPMTAIIYVSTLTAAVILFHERLNATRIVGVMVIAAGVVLLASDSGAADAKLGDPKENPPH